MICQACGVEAPTKYVEFYQNIGAIFMRFHKSIQGNFRTPDMGTRKMSGFQCRSFGAETSAQRRNGPKPRSSWKF